ncbi:MAG: FGGY-family carbohydrate kinase [Planctomycetaceae bacterium]|jgi:xylulokinase|nr:FGGY-family carbohydrate kinase [Planctomycetaceae bacterium]
MIISYDLGTGGNKASLFDADGVGITSVFEPYETFYPAVGRHEQRPIDWWNAVVRSTNRLVAEAKKHGITSEQILCLAISGHSLGCVPLDVTGCLLRETTPIWSDRRADTEAAEFFERLFDQNEWYFRTGNGFPAAHYTLFKILWYKNNEPELFAKIDKIIGTKDYINYRLTGVIATDYSYASGLGAYRLTDWNYDEELIRLSGLPLTLFPPIVPSTKILGTLKPDAASELGLTPKTLVAAGGVDNSCMALGAGAFQTGRLYASLGSSSWIAVADSKPLLNLHSKPYVFTHVVPEQFVSALSIFSSGTTFRWVRDQLCHDLKNQSEHNRTDIYELMIDEAKQSPLGANGILFNPSLGGGTPLDGTNIRGAFLGFDLSHTRADLIRAVMEGIVLNLRVVLDAFRKLTEVQNKMNIVGGGTKNDFWRQIYADVLRINIEKINIGQDAATLGAAALAAVGAGLWNDFSKIDNILNVEDCKIPKKQNAEKYDQLLLQFQHDAQFLAERISQKK